MQIDLFAEPAPPPSAAERHRAAIAAQPAILQPCCVAAEPKPETQSDIDAWTRRTQRNYLLYLVGAIQRLTYRESSIANVRHVLAKLNGLGGEW
jgi:hypothetical protein